MVIRLVIDFGELVKVAPKRQGGKRGGWQRYGDYCVLWPLYVFGYISVVLVEDAYVRNYRGWSWVQLVQ
jgi:hypothetical protein